MNARPPAPKTDSGLTLNSPIFNGLCFKQMRPFCCDLLIFVVSWGFGIYVFVYSDAAVTGSLAHDPRGGSSVLSTEFCGLCVRFH